MHATLRQVQVESAFGGAGSVHAVVSGLPWHMFPNGGELLDRHRLRRTTSPGIVPTTRIATVVAATLRS